MEKELKLKFLLIYVLTCSIFTATKDDVDAVAAHVHASTARVVCDIVFRNVPHQLLKERTEFIRRYPNETVLGDAGIYDRGYNKSVVSKDFVKFLKQVAEAVDSKPKEWITVYDFGCGTGETTCLIALLGTHAIGIEGLWTDSDVAKFSTFLGYCQDLSKKLGNLHFACEYKGRDLRATSGELSLEHDPKSFPSDSADYIFCGNLFHMFSPADAKLIVEHHLRRLMKLGAFVFASVDGVGAYPEIKEDYVKVKAAGKKFPSVFERQMMGSKEGKLFRKLVNTDTRYFFASVGTEGTTENPCRVDIYKELYFTQVIPETRIKVGTKLAGLSVRTTTVCTYDRELVEFIFSGSGDVWDIHVNTLPAGVDDEGVFQHFIIAQKK